MWLSCSGWNWWRDEDAHFHACWIKGRPECFPICNSACLSDCFGWGCRFSDAVVFWFVLHNFSKKYTTVGELGKATDTFDATGNVVQEKSYGMYNRYFNLDAIIMISRHHMHWFFCLFFHSRSHNKRGFWREAESVHWWNHAGAPSVSLQFIWMFLSF